MHPLGRRRGLPVPAHAGPGLTRARRPVRVDRLWLTDFRNYDDGRASALAPGLTAVRRAPTARARPTCSRPSATWPRSTSFRGAPDRRAGPRRAPSGRSCGPRPSATAGRCCIEAEIAPAGRNRVQVNRQPLRRARDLLGALRVTVFSPDDLELVKGGPAERRRLPRRHRWSRSTRRNDALRTRRRAGPAAAQRAAEAGRRPARPPTVAPPSTCGTPSSAAAGEALGRGPRRRWSADLRPTLAAGLRRGGRRAEPTSTSRYDAAVAGRRRAWPPRWPRRGATTLRRGVSLVGPHRDELELALDGLPARTHASQGEQRSLALALRLAAHRLVTDAAGTPPVLLLDDVFSELDPDRSARAAGPPPAGPDRAHHRRRAARRAPCPTRCCEVARRHRRRPRASGRERCRRVPIVDRVPGRRCRPPAGPADPARPRASTGSSRRSARRRSTPFATIRDRLGRPGRPAGRGGARAGGGASTAGSSPSATPGRGRARPGGSNRRSWPGPRSCSARGWCDGLVVRTRPTGPRRLKTNCAYPPGWSETHLRLVDSHHRDRGR